MRRASLPSTLRESSRTLVEAYQSGDRYALARLVTLVEDRHPDSEAILDYLFSGAGVAFRVGVTGPPGAGKSTLVAGLVRALRGAGNRVGVVAVDPSSPFSHGALLGDRIRLKDLSGDPGLYVRSMATRGSLGGLSRTTREVCDLIDAFGMDRILIETVGVGQSELDIVSAADTVVVVLVPESGDEIQAMKAGLMEIGDIFVVNKSDRDGADRMIHHLEEMLGGHPGRDGWAPRVVRCVARDATGIDALHSTLEEHRAHLVSGAWLAEKRRAGLRREVEDRVLERVGASALAEPRIVLHMNDGLDRVLKREESPYHLARILAGEIAGLARAEIAKDRTDDGKRENR
ncbi:MAG: methylmalonyl Co-A mutase-associated GTPase MeaB [bacterium]